MGERPSPFVRTSGARNDAASPARLSTEKRPISTMGGPCDAKVKARWPRNEHALLARYAVTDAATSVQPMLVNVTVRMQYRSVAPPPTTAKRMISPDGARAVTRANAVVMRAPGSCGFSFRRLSKFQLRYRSRQVCQ